MDLNEITGELGRQYRAWKESEKAKDKLKKWFFDAATEALKDATPSQVIERIEAVDEEEALRIAQRRFQRHRVVDVVEHSEGQWDLILEEDPQLKDFSWINPSDGQVYSRVIAEGAPSLDDESLMEEQPGLWEAITTEVTSRELRPLEELTPEQVAAIQPYLTMPKPQSRLLAPRKAKKEELDE